MLTIGKAFAPSNIALAKYWGKRDTQLNLPMNSSLSISLADKGSTATIEVAEDFEIIINETPIDLNSKHGKRLLNYLQRFPDNYRLTLNVNIPFAAGLASSACVFASIAMALNDLYEWQLPTQELSILARLGSGSAARSIEHGFVEWHAGEKKDGSDSYAERLNDYWPELRIGLCLLNQSEKDVGSREGMQRTVETSPLYSVWPSYANRVVEQLKMALANNDFSQLGQLSEQCAETMHATMLSAWPTLNYSLSTTVELKNQVRKMRHKGIEVYYTQDAGPNLKLLFLQETQQQIEKQFTDIEIINPFKGVNNG